MARSGGRRLSSRMPHRRTPPCRRHHWPAARRSSARTDRSRARRGRLRRVGYLGYDPERLVRLRAFLDTLAAERARTRFDDPLSYPAAESYGRASSGVLASCDRIDAVLKPLQILKNLYGNPGFFTAVVPPMANLSRALSRDGAGQRSCEHRPAPRHGGRGDRGAAPLAGSRSAVLEEPRAAPQGSR